MSVQKCIVWRNRYGPLHIETPLGTVNITIGLSDRRGRRVESIEVIPNNYAGEPKVTRSGRANTRLIELKTVKGGAR